MIEDKYDLTVYSVVNGDKQPAIELPRDCPLMFRSVHPDNVENVIQKGGFQFPSLTTVYAGYQGGIPFATTIEHDFKYIKDNDFQCFACELPPDEGVPIVGRPEALDTSGNPNLGDITRPELHGKQITQNIIVKQSATDYEFVVFGEPPNIYTPETLFWVKLIEK